MTAERLAEITTLAEEAHPESEEEHSPEYCRQCALRELLSFIRELRARALQVEAAEGVPLRRLARDVRIKAYLGQVAIVKKACS